MVKHSAEDSKGKRGKLRREKRHDCRITRMEFQLESNYKNLRISWVKPLKIPNYHCF
jgi:hypothetical protein